MQYFAPTFIYSTKGIVWHLTEIRLNLTKSHKISMFLVLDRRKNDLITLLSPRSVAQCNIYFLLIFFPCLIHFHQWWLIMIFRMWESLEIHPLSLQQVGHIQEVMQVASVDEESVLFTKRVQFCNLTWHNTHHHHRHAVFFYLKCQFSIDFRPF